MHSSRHRDVRGKLSGFAAALIAPAAIVLAPGAVADPSPAEQPGAPAADAVAPCCLELPAAPPAEAAVDLAAAPAGLPEAHAHLPADVPAEVPAGLPADGPMIVPAAHVDPIPRLLPPGDAPEQGLQIKTILASRSISAEFPQVTNMIGVRPDAKRWHPSGLAIDIMIPNADSAEGVALGDAILDYAMRNADRFGLQDVIWRGVYYTPAGPSGSGYGHFDHVHITTTGGGYPSGGEEYLSAG